MSIDTIKSEIRSLPPEERRRLIAYMVALDDQSRPDYALTLAKRLENKSPGAWLTIEECERELGLTDKGE